MMITISHFSPDEFKCRCCGQVHIDPELILMLEKLRAFIGNKPIHINCGYRCPKHNKKVGGVSNSQHLLGTAADIHVDGVAVSYLSHAADKVGFMGVGTYKTFVHVDVRKQFSRWRG